MFERDTTVGTMSSQVAKILGLRIVSGEFKPGEVLPIENELCRIYGVSRSTIREAVRNLMAKRLIEVAPKLGTRVLPFAEWNLLDPEVLSWRLNSQFDTRIVEDLYEMRFCFEPRACFLAARDGTADDLEMVRRKYHDLEAYFGQPDLAATADAEFHLAIIAATRNGLFVSIGGAVKTALRVSFAVMRSQGQMPRHDLSHYDAVLNHILAREGDAAAKAMHRLLEISRQHLLDAIGGGTNGATGP
ncbi:FadR/GntR family transcriptional regulator [Radicibacter daui]|uniref:FadR/GntR family transcriptional regulator n=1 Tax=Radicibacter daui TaxID=3064829 RepID=UPI004046D677